MPHAPAADQSPSVFETQVQTLLRNGFPALLGVSEAAFLDSLAGLVPPAADSVLVIPGAPEPAVLAMTSWKGGAGFTDMDPAEFSPVVPVPAAPYLAVGLSTGPDTLNITPEAALPLLAPRSPLTITEGLSYLLHNPGLLRTHNAFSLAGSRAGDRRVPAI